MAEAQSTGTKDKDQKKEDASEQKEKRGSRKRSGRGRGGRGRKNLTEGNQVWVSSQKSQRRLAFYGNIALKMFAKHETVELHGLGAAISSAVEVSQYLIATPYAVVKKIHTNMIQTTSARKPEIVIHLGRLKVPPPRESKVNIPDSEDRVVAPLEEQDEETDEPVQKK